MQVAKNSRPGGAARRRRLARRGREGNIAIIVVLLIGVIFGFASLAVDASQLYKVRTEGQNAADAAALAAADEIDGTSAGITAARELAVTFAPENRMYAGGAVADEANVTFGRWSAHTGVFTSLADTEVIEINAVRVQLTPASVHNPFAVLQGRSQTNVGAYAIAAAGGSASKCTSPMVVGDCNSGVGTNDDDRCLSMQGVVAGSNTDTAGWSNLNSPRPLNDNSPGTFATLLFRGCNNLIPGCAGYESSGTVCAGTTCDSTNVDELIGANNGTFFTETGGTSYGTECNVSRINNPCRVIKQLLLRQTNPDASEDPADLVSVSLGGTATDVLRGTYFEIKVPMIPGNLVTVSGRTYCSADYSAAPDERITGYATVDIFGVKCGNPNKAVVDDGYLTTYSTELAGLSCTPPAGDFVLGRMRIEEESGIGGGGNPGNSTARPRLVE